eukprot:UN20031
MTYLLSFIFYHFLK